MAHLRYLKCTLLGVHRGSGGLPGLRKGLRMGTSEQEPRLERVPRLPGLLLA